jgi:hypothetical protein
VLLQAKRRQQQQAGLVARQQQLHLLQRRSLQP